MTLDGPTWRLGAWDPRRRGPFYCSPACGGRCTWDAYQKAQRSVRALVRSFGPGWTPRIWENFGWHWEVRDTTGHLRVGSCGRGLARYSAYVSRGTKNRSCDFAGYANTPRKALALALDCAREEFAKERKDLESLVRLLWPVSAPAAQSVRRSGRRAAARGAARSA